MKKLISITLCLFFVLGNALKLSAYEVDNYNIVPQGNGAWIDGTLDQGTGRVIETSDWLYSSNFITIFDLYQYSYENWVDYNVYAYCYTEPMANMSFYLGFRTLYYNNVYGFVSFPQGTKYVLLSFENDPNGPIFLYPSGLLDTVNREGYQNGYEDGEWLGYQNGSFDTYETAKSEGYDLGYDAGYSIGYNNGINSVASENIGFDNLLNGMFEGVGTILSVEIFPNISIGMIVAVPLVFGVAMFILGRKVEK